MDSLTAARLTLRLLMDSRRTATGCRVLVGHAPQPNGYAMVYWRERGKQQQRDYVHRVAYRLWHGPIPAGHVVAHSCDNPPCWEPAHLVASTQADNLADMVAKGRSNRGERHWNWKGGTSRNYRGQRNRVAGALLAPDQEDE